MNEIFQIFNPDWWMDENNNVLQMTDAILFLLFLIPVAYLFIRVFSLMFRKTSFKTPEILIKTRA